MPADIYDQHKAAFSAVSAYVVLNGAKERVATIAFKFPRDGAGRLYCYLHVFGARMVRGFAGGGGYDKRSAAVGDAACKIPNDPGKAGHWTIEESTTFRELLKAARDARHGGNDWSRELENAGFTVLQAV